jgi:hypothetical protein
MFPSVPSSSLTEVSSPETRQMPTNCRGCFGSFSGSHFDVGTWLHPVRDAGSAEVNLGDRRVRCLGRSDMPGMSPADEPEFSAHGGGTLPLEHGRISATWPSALVTVEAAGVSVDLRTGWLSRFALVMLGVPRDRRRWHVAWADLSLAAVAKRDVFLHATSGEHTRVTFLTRDTTEHMELVLRRHGVRIRHDRNIFQARKP